MMIDARSLFLVATVGGALACTVGDDGKIAAARLESKSGSTVTGSAVFTETGNGVELVLEVSGASPGSHGVHLHAVGDCSAPDAMSAMGHWNPEMHPHGDPGSGQHHAGDCGNLTIVADGTGTLTFADPTWRIADGSTMDIVGTAIIVHENPDDLVTQMPPGNAGARQACGVIQ